MLHTRYCTLEFLSLWYGVVRLRYSIADRHAASVRYILLGVGCRSRSTWRKTHSSHYWTANERRQTLYVRVRDKNRSYARLEAEKDEASQSRLLLNHHLMRDRHCLLLEQRFALENRFGARRHDACLEWSVKERVSKSESWCLSIFLSFNTVTCLICTFIINKYICTVKNLLHNH